MNQITILRDSIGLRANLGRRNYEKLARDTQALLETISTLNRISIAHFSAMRVLVLLSPAKTLNWGASPASLVELWTQPKGLREADPVMQVHIMLQKGLDFQIVYVRPTI